MTSKREGWRFSFYLRRNWWEREKMWNVIKSVPSTFTWELYRTWFYPEHWESSVWRLCRLDLLLCRCKGRCCLPALSPAAEPARRWCMSAEEWTRGAGCPLATWCWGEVNPQHYRGGLRGNPVPLTPLRSHSPPWLWGELEKKQHNNNVSSYRSAWCSTAVSSHSTCVMENISSFKGVLKEPMHS